MLRHRNIQSDRSLPPLRDRLDDGLIVKIVLPRSHELLSAARRSPVELIQCHHCLVMRRHIHVRLPRESESESERRVGCSAQTERHRGGVSERTSGVVG